jgi:hypothetical protein
MDVLNTIHLTPSKVLVVDVFKVSFENICKCVKDPCSQQQNQMVQPCQDLSSQYPINVKKR